MSTRPQFLRRQEVAATLRLSTRQVDRLVEEGKLERVKTSARRSTITASSLDAYLAQQTGRQATEPYASPFIMCEIKCESGIKPGVAEAIDRYLTKLFPGIIVAEHDGKEITVTWAVSAGYNPDDNGRALAMAGKVTVGA
jgi:excisionase family DNA binding protein